MKRAQEPRNALNPDLLTQKAKSSEIINPKKDVVSKDSTNTVSLSKKGADLVGKKGVVMETNSKGTEDEENFEGDYFKDFYYAQGDYNKEKLEEEEEIHHAEEILEHEKEIMDHEKEMQK